MLVNARSSRAYSRVLVGALITFFFYFAYTKYWAEDRAWGATDEEVHSAPTDSRPNPAESRPGNPPSAVNDADSPSTLDKVESGHSADSQSSSSVELSLEKPKPTEQSSNSEVDGVIVMGRMSTEDTDWVEKHLPEWQHAIYTVDKPSGAFRVPMNKGHEGMPYLTYVIDHYDNLPETMVFLHSHEGGYPGGWHTDAPDNSNVWSVQRLQRSHVQRQGYVNLRCTFIPGCPDEIQPFRDPPDYSDDKKTERAMQQSWKELFNNTEVPHLIAVPCCAQFAVSKAQVLKRPRTDYIHFRQWIIESQSSDPGRILEYLWHIIFSMEPVLCPALEECYKDVYDMNYNSYAGR